MRFRCLLVTLLLCFSSFGYAYNKHQALFWVSGHIPADTVLANHEQVAEIYAHNQFQPVWYQYDAIKAFEYRLEFVVLADVGDLFYQRLLELKEARYQNRWQEYDILATDTLLSYMSYADQAAEYGKGWFFGGRLPQFLPPPGAESLSRLGFAVSSDTLPGFIAQLDSETTGYAAHMAAAEELKEYVNVFMAKYRQSRTLVKRGDKLTHKPELVLKLRLLGIDTSSINPSNGWYDKHTQKAVIEFQRRHGLKTDGVIGPNTIYWLNRPVEERMRLIALNAQRLRIWPVQRDRLVLVNVPQYQLWYWNEGETQFESKVIVGRPSRKTPLITTRMDSVILNPTWNVPHKIMVNDILPKAFDSQEYLSEHHYEIVNNWRSKEVIEPEAIDWSAITPASFPYRMRQQSGPYNALGLYKFNTPNKSAIFLHDTPAKKLFTRERRAFSSGCIRVEGAEKLAKLLLERSAAQPVDEASLTTEETLAITLKNRIPVHIIYQTVWLEGEEIHFRPDIYRYDHLSKSSNFDAKMTKIVDLNNLLSAQ